MPLFPYNINADTITSENIIGVNKVLLDSNYIESVTRGNTTYNRFTFTYEYEILLDDFYIGYINGSIQQSYRDYDVSMSSPTTENRSLTKPNTSYYVNGNSFKTSLSITAWTYVISGSSQVDPTNIYNPVFTLNTSNITKYQDIDSIDTVINILQDISRYVSIDILDELQDILVELQLSNDYLETISKFRQWHIPFESFNTISYSLSKNYPMFEFLEYNYYDFPIFEYTNGDIIYEFYSSFSNTDYNAYNVVFISNRSFNLDSIRSTFVLQNGSWKSLTRLYNFIVNGVEWSVYKAYISSFNLSVPNKITYTSNTDLNGVFLYFSHPQYEKYTSTDFALNFGLQNELLQNLDIIAQGTQQSNNSSSNLEDSADDIIQNSSTMFQFENQQNTNMNNALQSINTNFDIGTIGSSFLTSAAWVKTQFDNLTNTTPFGSVLSFSLLLGLALLIIGKVYK